MVSFWLIEVGVGWRLAEMLGNLHIIEGKHWDPSLKPTRPIPILKMNPHLHLQSQDGELIESLSLRGSEAFLGAMGFDACLTIFAFGPLAEEVVTQLQIAATWLAGRSGARVSHVPSDMPKLTGRAVMGLTKLSDGAVARLMAEKTEDVYRILHHCLSPLSQHLGVEPYADRVHGIESLPETPLPTRTSAVRTEGAKEMVRLTLDLDLKRALTLCQLTDATLPVGGFAHSNGIEAASQLGLCESEDVESLRTLVVHGARSMLRLQGYFVKAAHQLGGEEERIMIALLTRHLMDRLGSCFSCTLKAIFFQELGFQHSASIMFISIPFSSLNLLSFQRNEICIRSWILGRHWTWNSMHTSPAMELPVAHHPRRELVLFEWDAIGGQPPHGQRKATMPQLLVF